MSWDKSNVSREWNSYRAYDFMKPVAAYMSDLFVAKVWYSINI